MLDNDRVKEGNFRSYKNDKYSLSSLVIFNSTTELLREIVTNY